MDAKDTLEEVRKAKRLRKFKRSAKEAEMRYGYYHPKNVYGEVRVGTWDSRLKRYVGFHYFDGPDAEERALDYADDLMRQSNRPPCAAYPEGEDLVEAVFHDGYTGFHGTAMREWNKEEVRRTA